LQHNEKTGQFREIVRRYEAQKRVWGKLDFSDLLFKYAGVRADENLQFQDAYAEGSVPAEIKLWIVDEFQDCSDILGMCCLRLSEAAGELWMLGDRYQSVYGFSGANWRLMAAFEDEAKESGRRILLNRSWRNPERVVEWGENVLETDAEYDSREPVGLNGEGTVGLVEWRDFQSQLPLLATSDTMILSRTWWNLGRVTQFLDSAGIPWRSIQDKQKSRWESPVQVAFVLVMRELGGGGRISESDWRRVTEELPQKMNGQELFVRGAKAKWKKIECSREPKRTLDELEDWGAAAGFADWVRAEKWRIDKALLLDQAIDKFGIDCVREPGLRLGSCHAAKGMEAKNVFVLASSTEKASGKDVDFYEDLFLKYVSITRASENYRLVVDSNDLVRGKPMFWAAPKGFREYVPLPQEAYRARERRSDEDHQLGAESAQGLGVQVSGDTVQFERGPGSAAGSGPEVSGARSEEAGRKADADAAADSGGDPFDWITI
jgi:superfamily I DNA/RNA helicase